MVMRRMGLVVIGLVLLGSGSIASGTNVILILKEGQDFRAGGGVDSVFAGASTANVVTTGVDDTYFDSNPATYYYAFGQKTTARVACLFKFDLSSIPPGSTVSKAQLRLYGGNGTVTCGVCHHS